MPALLGRLNFSRIYVLARAGSALGIVFFKCLTYCSFPAELFIRLKWEKKKISARLSVSEEIPILPSQAFHTG